MKTAIIYDWIDKSGGVERILPIIAGMYPDADFYTSYVNPEKARWANGLKIRTSFIQKFPDFIKSSRVLSLPFYKYAFEAFDLSDYKLVISVTSAFAKGVITKPGTKHITYLLTPTRYIWGQTDNYTNSLTQVIGQPAATSLRKWDYIAAQRPDRIITISNFVASRIKTYYRRDATVIYPAFDTEYWSSVKPKSAEKDLPIKDVGYYLFVGRLEPYKKVELLVETFNKLHYPLFIVGTGSQESSLRRKANENIIFVPYVSDEKLAEYYIKARALIMPQEEEFGYTALEAQFFGTPVISYRNSGVAETILDRKSGLFFKEQTSRDLYDAIATFENLEYNMKRELRKSAAEQLKRFNKERFIKEFASCIAA